jgi:hypothetical protein
MTVPLSARPLLVRVYNSEPLSSPLDARRFVGTSLSRGRVRSVLARVVQVGTRGEGIHTSNRVVCGVRRQRTARGGYDFVYAPFRLANTRALPIFSSAEPSDVNVKQMVWRNKISVIAV